MHETFMLFECLEKSRFQQSYQENRAVDLPFRLHRQGSFRKGDTLDTKRNTIQERITLSQINLSEHKHSVATYTVWYRGVLLID